MKTVHDGFEVHWDAGVELTVADAIKLEQIEDSDSIVGLVGILTDWIESVIEIATGESVGIERLPLRLLTDVVQANPNFRAPAPNGSTS